MSAALLLSPLAAGLLSPLLAGLVNRTKSIVAGRKGPPLLQGYYDLLRLFRKESVYSTTTSWIFRAAPWVIFCCTLAATCIVPVVRSASVALFPGDFILLVYLLALARFFLILSALDTGSAFGGMGASREAFFSSLSEPVLFLCFLNVLRAHGQTGIASALASTGPADAITLAMTAIPLFILLLAENSRIPVDDPATHLELTMIHEAMILDNSGRGLGLMEYAASIKLWLFSLLLAGIVLPPLEGLPPIIRTGLLLALVALVAVAAGIVESVMARLRLVKIPHLLFSAGVIALLGFFMNVTGALTR
jgi:formate hydrogenlyase subunit 4